MKINPELGNLVLRIPHCDHKKTLWIQKIPSDINKVFPDVTKNLTGTILKVAVSKGLALNTVFVKDQYGKVKLAGGFCNEIFLILQKTFGFEYSIQIEDGFGKLFPNGSFTGVVGSIQRQEAEFAIDMGFSAQRLEVIEYLPPVVFATLRFFTRVPSHVPRWKLVLEPFT
ncbi:unnamed protein product, partial [Allacma fusca]